MTLTEVLALIEDVREEFQHEEDQGLLQRDLHKAEMALAGRYACERIIRRLTQRAGVEIVPPRTVGRAK